MCVCVCVVVRVGVVCYMHVEGMYSVSWMYVVPAHDV